MTKSRSKLNGRPVSTSAITQPSSTGVPLRLSSFSPDALLFAFVVLAVDKHRLRVYNTISGRAVSEHTVNSGRVSSLTWAKSPLGFVRRDISYPSKKRKTITDDPKEAGPQADVVVLGLSEGTILFFSPSHSRVLCTLAHPTSTSPVLSLAFDPSSEYFVWTSSADSSIRLWDIENNTVLKTWKNQDRIPCTTLSIRPTNNDNSVDILTAHHSIRLFTQRSGDESASGIPKQLAAFTGHATCIKALLWTDGTSEPTKFFSIAEGDRCIYYWDTEDPSSSGNPLASTSLDSDVGTIVLDSSSSQRSLIALSVSGKLSFIPIPAELPSPHGDNSHNVYSLLPRSSLLSVSKSRLLGPPIADLAPLSGVVGSIRVARFVKDIQPVFDIVQYLDENGNYIQSPTLDEIREDASTRESQLAPNKRYVESKSLVVGTGFDINSAANSDESIGEREVDGTLQVDLAELSLGQKLTALSDRDLNIVSESEDDDAVTGSPRRTKSTKKQARTDFIAIPTNSLTRTLIQALHSSDSRLLELCLAHSDPALILNTIRRLPPQLAIPLITACVERLGRGSRSASMKGGGGGASSQRGSSLLTWLRIVLAVHTGHLMTLPDLVARLSGLHATLTARLSLHESLLSLSGRLDMVLSQVELRASTTPASLVRLKPDKKKSGALIKRYVEGETDSGEEETRMEVEVYSDDEGSVEDIELGGGSEDEDDDEDENGEDGENHDFSGSDDGLNGFIDDEAEEEYSDNEDDDESE